MLTSDRVAPGSTHAFKQQGAVLVISLIVLVAMTWAAIAMMRSVDLSQSLTGNIGFKRDAINRASMALEEVSNTLTDGVIGPVIDNYCLPPAACVNGLRYSPRLLASDERGVPLPLVTKATYDAVYSTPWLNDAASATSIRYLIERMCSDFGTGSVQTCSLPMAELGGDTAYVDANRKGGNPLPLFRVTIRVDGPRETTAFAQAVVDINEPL